MKRGYQYRFSELLPASQEVFGRERKAQTMVAVLGDFLELPLAEARVLDVGGSGGAIDNTLANHFGSVIGVDIDEPAIARARIQYHKPNLEYRVGDALNLDFAANSFEVVICSHVYEHVPDAQRMMDEILRVLVPGGVCYFAAGNRFMWNEPHYNLPLLSAMPRPLAHLYMRLASKGTHYHELHFSYWGLRKLARAFILHDYTLKLIRDPEKYAVGYMFDPGSFKALMADLLVSKLRFLSPGYIWLLEKPSKT